MEPIKLRFASCEKEFIYNEGVNRGHTQSYSKVNRCLFLSAEAKQLYTNITEYAYNGKRDCFPSQLALCTQLGWSRNTLKKYTDELVDAGLIKIYRPDRNSTYVYHLNELHEIPMLAHSELVHEIIVHLKDYGEDVLDAIEDYKKSDLYLKANENPVGHESAILEYLLNYLGGKVEKQEQKPVEEEQVVQRYKLPNFGKPPEIPSDMQRVSSLDGERKKTTSKVSYKDLPVTDWNAGHFIEYFNDKHLEVKKLPLLAAGMQERGQMKRLVDLYSDNKEILRQKIDIYLTNDYFFPKAISNFCSNFTQGMIQHYLKTGSFDRKKGSSLVPQGEQEETVVIDRRRRGD